MRIAGALVLLGISISCTTSPKVPASARADRLLWRFAKGGLPPGWQASGKAFLAQPVCDPVKTDRIRLPNGQKLARLAGDYWITPANINFDGCRIDSGPRAANGGTLTSPSFTIDRPFLDMFIGGGGGPDTNVSLFVDTPDGKGR